jgi:predicted nucleic acid-binding protein
MATMIDEPVFVDTNLLVYTQQAHSPFHLAATQSMSALASGGRILWISRQVLREYLAAMSRPGALTKPIAMSSLVADVKRFEAQFQLAEDGSAVTRHLLDILNSTACAGKQVHDANIVATMLAHGIPKLLTHNVADFTRFSSLITIVPLIP